MDFYHFRIISLVGGTIRFLIYYPKTKRKYMSFFVDENGDEIKEQNRYNWIVGSIGIIVILIVLKMIYSLFVE